jgi:hypothetical protein
MISPGKDGCCLVGGFGAERIRIKAARKGDRPALKLELLAPLTAHTPDTLATVGRGLLIPLDALPALVAALNVVRQTLEAGL